MYLLLSLKTKRWVCSADFVSREDYVLVSVSDNLETWPIFVWFEDHSVDYLEFSIFGEILRRECVWPPIRKFECPVVSIQPVFIEDWFAPRIAISRLNRLLSEKKTLNQYVPDGMSIYFDMTTRRPFYRIPWDEKTEPIQTYRTSGRYFRSKTGWSFDQPCRCFDAVTGQDHQPSSDIEEVVYPNLYQSNPAVKRFNIVLVYRPFEKTLYLYNAQSGNLLSSTHISEPCYGENSQFALGSFLGKIFFRPNPNMFRRFAKFLPNGSLNGLKTIPIIPSYTVLLR